MWTDYDEKKIQETLLEINMDFYDKIGKGFFYLQMPSSESRFYMWEQIQVLKEYNVRTNAPLLEYGSGVGTFMLLLWRYGYVNVEGRDVDPIVLDASKVLFKKFKTELQANQVGFGDIYDISGKFDVIFMNDFLYAKSIRIEQVMKSVHEALHVDGLWCFDFLSKETPQRENIRNYYSPVEISEIVGDLFTVEKTISHTKNGNNVKVLYICKRK